MIGLRLVGAHGDDAAVRDVDAQPAVVAAQHAHGGEVVGVERKGSAGDGRIDGHGLHHESSYAVCFAIRRVARPSARLGTQRGPGLGAHVARGHRPGAVGAGELGHHGMPAAAVHQLDGRTGVAGHPAVAPASERHDDRPEVAALLGQPVLEARRALLVLDAVEHAGRDQPPQAVGEAVARQTDGAEVLEAARAEERVAQHEQRPAIADDRERSRHRAGQVSDVTPAHG